jgi:ribosome-binding protein aMBF1 (putative translation factor)
MTRRLISNAEVLDDLLKDPEFREQWERTALARAVAEAVIRYRTERGLSQTALGRLLGWSQPVIARLEAAEHNPTMDTLVELARKLRLRVHVDVGPETGVVAKVTKSRAA